MTIEEKLHHQIEVALNELNLTWPDGARIEHPADETHGDYASNVALILAGQAGAGKIGQKIGQAGVRQAGTEQTKQTGQPGQVKQTATPLVRVEEIKNPRKLAEKIVAQLKQVPNLKKIATKIEVAGPGFINFHLSEHFLLDSLVELNTKSTQIPQVAKLVPAKQIPQAEKLTPAKQPTKAEQLTKAKQLPQTRAGEKIIIEYSSPNIAKPFTVGHLRSTIIGDAIANLLEASGAKVWRDNHLGDWGTQFGKQIYALKAWGDEAKIARSEQPAKELVKLYVKFHQEAEKESDSTSEGATFSDGTTLEEKARAWFKKLEEGDAEARRLWQQCVDWSWQEFEQIYRRLGVSFSQEFNDGRGLGESFFEDQMTAVIEELKEKNLLREGEAGAQLVFFADGVSDADGVINADGVNAVDGVINADGEGEDRGEDTDGEGEGGEEEEKNGKEKDGGEAEYPPAMILKGDGATLYHTRDLATDKYRLDHYHPDVIINEVGAEQKLYFKQLFKMEEMLGWFEPGQRIHIKHGLYRFKDKKMSTRRGNVIWLEEVLQEAYDRVVKIAEERLSQEQIWQVAIGALKWNDLKRKPELDVVFDWDEIVRLDGNSGPYVQYAATRALSVLRKAEKMGLATVGTGTGMDTGTGTVRNRAPHGCEPWETVTNRTLEAGTVTNRTNREDNRINTVANRTGSTKLAPFERRLTLKLLTFPEVFSLAVAELAPHQLCTYLFELAQLFNRFYHQHQILQAETAAKKQLRLQLTAATAKILEQGLQLLGIETLEEM